MLGVVEVGLGGGFRSRCWGFRRELGLHKTSESSLELYLRLSQILLGQSKRSSGFGGYDVVVDYFGRKGDLGVTCRTLTGMPRPSISPLVCIALDDQR